MFTDATNPVGGHASQAIGRTKGGLNTKIHAVVNSNSEGVVIASSAGNEADIFCAQQRVGNLSKGSVVVADKAYDSNTLRDFVSRHKDRACITPRSNRLKPRTYSSKTYRDIVGEARQQLLDDADAVAVLLEDVIWPHAIQSRLRRRRGPGKCSSSTPRASCERWLLRPSKEGR